MMIRRVVDLRARWQLTMPRSVVESGNTPSPQNCATDFSSKSLAPSTLFAYRARVTRFFAMLACKEHLVLLLVVTGTFGCASTERLSQRPVRPPAQIPQKFQFENNFAQPTTESLPLDSSAVAASTVPMEPEPTPDAAPVEVIPPPSTSLEQKPGRSNTRERSPQPTHAAPSAAQPARVRRADNRLLELLDKDLDKAIEHPNEPRRLQFSKEVTNNGHVRRFVRYYSTTGKNRFQELLGRSGKYMPMIAKVLSQDG